METETLKKSFSLLVKNPILFVPDIFLVLSSYLLLYFLSFYSGLNEIFPLLDGTLGSADLETILIEAVQTTVSANLLQIILSGIILFIFTFIIGVGVTVLKYEMINDMLRGKKASLKNAWRQRKSFFLSVILLRVLVFIITLLALVVVFIGGGLTYLIVNPFSNTIAIAAAGLVGIIITIILAILIKLALLFRYPIMFMKDERNALKALTKSITLFEKKPLFTFITLLIMFAVGILLGIIGSSLTYGINFSLSFATVSMPVLFIVLLAIATVINYLFDLAADLWGAIFLFARFKQKSKHK